MKILIRDDDINYFTDAEILEEIYSNVWGKNIYVYFGVIPFQKGEKSGQVPEEFQDTDKIFPVEENKQLIQFLREKAKKGKVKIALHGYHHKNENGKAEFFSGTELYMKMKEGKNYLEKIFDSEVNYFIPPHNEISRSGVKAAIKNEMYLLNIPKLLSQPVSSLPDYLKHKIFWRKYKLPYPYPLKLGKKFQIGCISVYKSAKREEIKEIIEFYKKFPESLICFAFHWWEIKNFPYLKQILEDITTIYNENICGI